MTTMQAGTAFVHEGTTESAQNTTAVAVAQGDGIGPEIVDATLEVVLSRPFRTAPESSEVEAAFCGNVYCGTAAGHQTIGKIGMTGIPIVNVENACSSGASAPDVPQLSRSRAGTKE